ncbi:MAG: MarR family transcriptional regulator [Deltaproteobacteria bacterium]|nr:MarR family transcriptional regulator [Deltaproteobacteria bacterium]MBW2387677.1 MarR family transcriptional regulator [Deltaproteobacteria bacterium]MBW2724562.1 MarR family transcriptional regulator [Deltaproteobacteria bacterium]
MTELSKHELDAPPWLRVESTLMSLARGIRRAYDLRLEELGLNLSEAMVLAYTQESGPLMQADLAKRLGVGRAAMGSLIDSLEGRGLVERCPKPGDRRVWLVASTPSGDEVAHQVTKIDERLRAELRAGISRKERRELTQLLNRLRENVGKVFSEERG